MAFRKTLESAQRRGEPIGPLCYSLKREMAEHTFQRQLHPILVDHVHQRSRLLQGRENSREIVLEEPDEALDDTCAVGSNCGERRPDEKESNHSCLFLNLCALKGG